MGSVGVREDLKLVSLLGGEPVEVLSVGGCCVYLFREVQDESGCRVLNSLEVVGVWVEMRA